MEDVTTEFNRIRSTCGEIDTLHATREFINSFNTDQFFTGGLFRDVKDALTIWILSIHLSSLDLSRTITCSCMSPCRVDHITVFDTTRSDILRFESAWILLYLTLYLGRSSFDGR